MMSVADLGKATKNGAMRFTFVKLPKFNLPFTVYLRPENLYVKRKQSNGKEGANALKKQTFYFLLPAYRQAGLLFTFPK